MALIDDNNPALPGSKTYSDPSMMIPFGDFVSTFTQNHRSGQPWTVAEIANETGMTPTEVNAYLTYMHQKQSLVPPMPTAQIAALIPVLSKTPFGPVFSDPLPTSQPISSILSMKLSTALALDLTLGDLIAAFKS